MLSFICEGIFVLAQGGDQLMKYHEQQKLVICFIPEHQSDMLSPVWGGTWAQGNIPVITTVVFFFVSFLFLEQCSMDSGDSRTQIPSGEA